MAHQSSAVWQKASTGDAFAPSFSRPSLPRVLSFHHAFPTFPKPACSETIIGSHRHITISYATKTLITWTFILLICIHWYCCAWGLLAQLEGTQRTLQAPL